MKNFTLEKVMPLNLIYFDIYPDRKEINTSKYEVTFSIVTVTDSNSSESLKKAQLEHNINFTKAITFMEAIVNNSLVIGMDYSQEVENFLADFNNNIIVIPEVLDSSLIAALHCKLNSIISENTAITSLSFKDTSEGLVYTYTCTSDEEYDELPTSSEWVKDLSYWDTPWWYRNDVTTMDKVAETIEEHEKWLHARHETQLDEKNYAIFEDIESAITDMSGSGTTDPAEIIQVDFQKSVTDNSWKPRIV